MTTWPSTLPPGPVAATGGAIATAITLDTAGLAILLLGAITAPLQGVLSITVCFALAFIVYVAAQLYVLLYYGRTLGLWALHLRRVTRSDGAPTGLIRAFTPCWFADLSKGRDPVLPEPLMVAIPPATPAPPVSPPGAAPVPAPPAPPQVPPAPSRSHQRGVPTHARVAPPPHVESAPAHEVDDRELTLIVRKPESNKHGMVGAEDFDPYNTGTLARSVLVVDGQPAASFDTRAVLGRQPVVGDGEQAVPVVDMDREISKTHLAISRDQNGRVWVVDLNSTNGTVVRNPDGAEYELPARETREVPPGGVILFGSHTVTVQQRLARYENETRMIEKAPL